MVGDFKTVIAVCSIAVLETSSPILSQSWSKLCLLYLGQVQIGLDRENSVRDLSGDLFFCCFLKYAIHIPGVLQTKRWHPAAGIVQRIDSECWITMIPPSYHVTLFSTVQIRSGELPEAAGEVSLFVLTDKNRKDKVAPLVRRLMPGKPLLMHAERLHVLLNRPSFALGEWIHLGIWSVEVLPPK